MFIPRPEHNPGKKIVIFSGAGLDAPSGIRTFRDADGLWNEHKIEDVCTQSTWKQNFELVHEFYNQRRADLKNSEPNEAHHAIRRIVEKYGKENVLVVTMNVSDLHEKAGVECLHVHGDLTKMECEACGNNWTIAYHEFNIKTDRCPKCNSLKGVRPKIVFFGGAAPMYSYMNRAFEYLNNKDSIGVVIGTQGNVVPVDYHIGEKNCYKILCNMEKSKYILDDNYDDIYYESVETAILKIEKDIEEYWFK